MARFHSSDIVSVIARSRVQRLVALITLIAAAAIGVHTSVAATRRATAAQGQPRATRPAVAAQQGPRWRLTFFDNFSQGLRSADWGLYSGEPGGDPGGWWSPSHVVVANGVVNLETYRDPKFGGRWVSAGISNSPGLKQTYGKYVVRLRMDAGKGVGIAVLLWPVSNQWPPEVDFAENGGNYRVRNSFYATLHYGRHENHQISRSLHVNMTRWHSIGVEWMPHKLLYTIDGRVWGAMTGAMVPAQPMALDIQTSAGTCSQWWAPCPDASTPPLVDTQIKSVAAYAYMGPGSAGAARTTP